MILKNAFLTVVHRTQKKLLKAVVITLVFSLFVGGCSSEWWVGDGRGDWSFDLFGGYYIDKANSYAVSLCNDERKRTFGPGKFGSMEFSGESNIIIPSYFVTACLLREPYICLEGIQTEEWWTISEDELNTRVLIYYLVNAENDEIYGPFESYVALITFCHSLGIQTKKDEWIQIDSRSDTPPTKPYLEAMLS